MVARYGGNDFVALCRSPIDTLEAQVNKLQQDLTLLIPAIHFSYGIAQYQQDWQSTFKQADINMYQQKRLKKYTSID